MTHRGFTVGYWGFILGGLAVGLRLNNPFPALGGFVLTAGWTWWWLHGGREVR